ncbi:DUF1146 family protein [Paenibacillus sp. NPDC058071]|uniref:DUF1146 family protein n=1 Tax=Paenibacillus sp. NPDC058071 TaxID=3346326 RepID=UPI0036DB288A
METDQIWRNIAMTSGMTGLFSIVVTLLCIILVWYILQEIKLDVFFKFPRSPKARLFQVILAIVIGHGLASFVLDYWSWTVLLRGFIE